MKVCIVAIFRFHIVNIIFAKNCMKMKEFGTRGGGTLAPSLDPPIGLNWNLLCSSLILCWSEITWQVLVEGFLTFNNSL